MFTLYDKIQYQIDTLDQNWIYSEESNNYNFKLKTYSNKNDSAQYISENNYMFEIINRYSLYYNTEVPGQLDTILVQMSNDLLELMSMNSEDTINTLALELISKKYTYDADSKDYEIIIMPNLVKCTHFEDDSNAYIPYKEEIYFDNFDNIENQYQKSLKMYTILNAIKSHNNYTYTYFKDFYNIMYAKMITLDDSIQDTYLDALYELRDAVYYETPRVLEDDVTKELCIKGYVNIADDTITDLLQYVYIDIEGTEYSELNVYDDTTKVYYIEFDKDFISPTSITMPIKSDIGINDTTVDITIEDIIWANLVNTKKTFITSYFDKLQTFIIDLDIDAIDIWNLHYYEIARAEIPYLIEGTDPEEYEDIMTVDFTKIIELISKYIKVEQDTIKDKDNV